MALDESRPFQVVALDHVVIVAHDPAALRGFYVDALGCEVVWDRPELGLVHLRAGDALIDLVSAAGPLGTAGVAHRPGSGRNVDHLCLRVAPFVAADLAAHFARFGVTPGEPARRFGATGWGTSVYLTDPEGNGIELKEG